MAGTTDPKRELGSPSHRTDGTGEFSNGRDEALEWLIRVIGCAGGRVDSSERPGSLLDVWCDDRGPGGDDTFNIAHQRGYLQTSHDTSHDTSKTWLTAAGFAFWKTLPNTPAPSIPAGWVVVPRVPTPEMLQPACKNHTPGEPMPRARPSDLASEEECPHFVARRRIWCSMLAAAPSPVVEGGDQGSKSCAFQPASSRHRDPEPSSAAGALPAPRLQLRWEPYDGESRIDANWVCHYELVLPLREHDIRREIYEDGEQVGERSELVIPIKGPTHSRTTRPPSDAPFRDGAHSIWDARALGNPPIYVITGDGEVILQPARAEQDPLPAQGVTGGAEPCPACLGEAEGCGVCNERGAA